MKLRYPLNIVVIALCLVSCNQSTKEDKMSSYDKEQQMNSLNINQAKKLSERNNAAFGWDTSGDFTYVIQEQFDGTHKLMPFVGRIRDIIKEDSNYVLKVAHSYWAITEGFLDWKAYTTFAAEILVPQHVFYSLNIAIDEKNSLEGCFIIDVSNIKESHPVLDSEVDSDGPNVEDASSHVTLDFDQAIVIVKGSLVDFYIYDKLKD